MTPPDEPPDERPDKRRLNVADRLTAAAATRPDAVAVAASDPRGRWETVTFAALDADATALAYGLAAMGVGPGARIALLVRPGVAFVTLVFALLRTGATMVLVDSGLGRKNIVRCLESTRPDGFVAIPAGHALRVLQRRRFATATRNVTVGRPWFWGGWHWGGETLDSLRSLGRGSRAALPPTTADDQAAVVFTSGSTGPPKGVLYTHGTFATQCAMIQRQYDIRPGDTDLACFPLFGLFNVACGVTTVLPAMDFARPASCDPRKVLAAANRWGATQAFASPAVWDRVSKHCAATGERIPTLRKLLSCGAPVPAKVLRRTLDCVHPDATMHTPYGATEALPIATIEAREVLGETAAKTAAGAGVCVGRKFASDPSDGFDCRVIRISEKPIATIAAAEDLLAGEIGELIVRGPQVSQAYLNGEPHSLAPGATHNALAKIADGDRVWHRMGDVGYFDTEHRFWCCGRMSQRVVTPAATLYTECVEGVCNSLPGVERSALVAIRGGGSTRAAVVVEPTPNAGDVLGELRALAATHPALAHVQELLLHPNLPTDVRHNSKIRREELAAWAERRVPKRSAGAIGPTTPVVG